MPVRDRLPKFIAQWASWMGFLCLATGMMWAEGTFGWAAPKAGAGLFFLGLAMLCCGAILQGAAAASSSPAFSAQRTARHIVLRLLIAGALAGSGLYLHGPFEWSAGLVALALLLEPFPKSQALSKASLAAAYFIGLWWILYHIWGARFHEFAALAPALASVLHFLGLSVGVEGHLIHIQTNAFALPFAVSWQNFGDWAVLTFLLAPLAGALAGWKLYIAPATLWGMRLLLAAFFYSFTQLLFQIVIISELPLQMSLFQHPLMQAALFLPLTAILALLCRPGDERAHTTMPLKRPRRAIVATGFALCAGLGLGATLFFVPAGPAKKGRILIDETHSEWEETTKPLNTKEYGRLSTYNYWCLARWLEHYYSVKTLTQSRLDTATLSGNDILILKCPTRAYAPEEVAAILQFVRAGGGLLLVGDHTNVFGMNTYLNQIADSLGVHLNHDATYDLTTGGLSTWHPPLRTTHPAVQHVHAFDFMTSCTLRLGWGARAVIVGPGLNVGLADYATAHFFERPKQFLQPHYLFGLFIQCATGDYGRGRWLVWTDSTCWSNFSVFMDGNPPLIQDILAFLNHQAPRPESRLLGIGLFAISVLGIWTLMRRAFFNAASLAASLLAGLMMAGIGAQAYHEKIYAWPSPTRPLISIVFDQAHGDFVIRPASGMARDLIKGPSELLDLTTFFIWTQRLGLYPRLEENWNSLLRADAIVLALPGAKLTPQYAKRLLEWIKSGGRLLLLLDAAHQTSTAEHLLSPLGMSLYMSPISRKLSGKKASASQMAVPVLSIKGGQPFKKDDAERIIAATAAWGRGKMVVYTAASCFSTDIMGGAFAVPNDWQAGIYELEYELLRETLAGRLPPE